MRKIFLTLSVGLLPLVACTTVPVPGGSSSSSSSAAPSATTHYEDSAIGYGIDVPAGWTTVQNKDLVAADYEAKGTAFVPTMPVGTTLNEAYFHVAQIAACPLFSEPRVATTTVTIAGIAFQRGVWNDAGAGNLYEGVSYAGPKDEGCLVLTGFMHSCNLGAECGENHSAPFGKDAYLSAFDAMAKSLKLAGIL